MNLLPYPRELKRDRGFFLLPKRATLQLDEVLLPLSVSRSWTRRLQEVATKIGVKLTPPPRGAKATIVAINVSWGKYPATLSRHEEYRLTIGADQIKIEYVAPAGLRAAIATLRQLWREHGRRLPCLRISDWPEFAHRGVMLDISRGRVPRRETLLELIDHLADFKINELQLYTEHTFAYRRHRRVWRDWGALTAADIRALDARCRELGIDLIPNQNSFGHLRSFLEQPNLRKLAEVPAPYPDPSGEFVRRPSTLAPNHPGTLRFLRGLYKELLPNFSSAYFNVGCDETFDLGLGQSKKLCVAKGKGRVYLDFLKKIEHEVASRGRRIMFWGDIILHYPKLIRELPRNIIALNWGYEANHPFARETAQFAKSKIPFYVCPGTSTWMTLVGRHDNALVNLRAAARAGRRNVAAGYLITDWGDGGHPQPLTISYLPFLAGAAMSWCEKTFAEHLLAPVLSRDVFNDPSGRIARAAWSLGFAHRQLKFTEPNLTPLGAVIAAPPPEERELFCRKGLTYYRRIAPANIRRTLKEIERHRATLSPALARGNVFALELDLAARMAAQSCQFMLWQQAVARGNKSRARTLAKIALRELRELDRDFNRLWPRRNLATPKKCSAFLSWRMAELSKTI